MGLDSDHLGPGRAFPLVLPVVVYSGRRRWTAPRDVRDLLTPAPHGLLGSRPRHPYLLIELQRLGPPPLPEENMLSMIAALERARSPKRLEELALSLRDWVERAEAHELLDSFRGVDLAGAGPAARSRGPGAGTQNQEPGRRHG